MWSKINVAQSTQIPAKRGKGRPPKPKNSTQISELVTEHVRCPSLAEKAFNFEKRVLRVRANNYK